MLEQKGNIWSPKCATDFILVTTNNINNQKQQLIMGAGIALECAKRYPLIPAEMGRFGFKDYLLKLFPEYGIGCLQTKRNWREPSPIDLVAKSIERLSIIADSMPNTLFHLPRPGCGHGKLDWESQVKPLCQALPDNCIVWSQ